MIINHQLPDQIETPNNEKVKAMENIVIFWRQYVVLTFYCLTLVTKTENGKRLIFFSYEDHYGKHTRQINSFLLWS